MIFANLFSGLTAKIFGGVALALLIFASVQTARIEGIWCGEGEKPSCIIRGFKQELQIVRIDLAEAEARARAEASKHKATKQAYREAQEEAARMQAEIVAKEIARQERITDAVRKDYQQRLAALRARADRLRAQAEAAGGGSASGSSGQVRVPLNAGAAAGTGEAPRCDYVPAPDLGTEIRCREIAEEQAIQLDALITWVLKQVGQ
jgi:hypothetical protein